MQYSKAIIVEAQQPVTKAISKIRGSGLAALVFEGKKYVGILDERMINEKRIDPGKALCSTLAVKTPSLSPSMDPLEISRAFLSGRFKSLPVFDSGKLLGTVGRFDLLSMLDKGGYLKGHKVSGHMTSPMVTIDYDANVGAATALMRESGVRRLAIIKNKKLAGLVSVFDLMDATRDEKNLPRMKDGGGAKIERLPLASFMKDSVVSVGKDAPLSEVVKLILRTRRAGIIVSENEMPVGIITASDILDAALRSQMQLPVMVSGLHGMEKEFGDDVVLEGEALLSKLQKRLDVDGISIHIKQAGKEYSVSMHVRGMDSLRSCGSAYELMAAMRDAVDDIMAQARKRKRGGISKRRN